MNNSAEVIEKEIAEVLPELFLQYSTEIIKERAIPQIKDGLKPIQRRILYAMYKNHNTYDKKVIKSAKTVGLVISELSPHGDASTYEAMVGMAQPFTMRYPLIFGAGNFGDIAGHPAAAYRYTQAKISAVGQLMLEDIEKETVDMQPNYDNSTEEPITLGGYFPNQLVNATTGIAVGIATTFAPHYLKDVIKAATFFVQNLIDEKPTFIDDLIDIVKAPDFPTGGIIINPSALREVYKTGHGKIILQAKYKIEDHKIIIYEIPYKVNYNSLISSIVNVAETIPDIKDVKDVLTDKVQIIIELKKTAQPEYIINQLLRKTNLRTSYNCNFTAINEEQKPVKNITLMNMFAAYIFVASTTLNRSLTYDMKKYKDRFFKIMTLLYANKHIEKIMEILKKSDAPKKDLMENLELKEEQVDIILKMTMSSLSKLSKKSLEQEEKELNTKITKIEYILNNRKEFLKCLKDKIQSVAELKIFKDDKRKTKLKEINYEEDDERNCIKNEAVFIAYTDKGAIKNTRLSEYRIAKGQTKGSSIKIKEGENILKTLTLTTHDDLYCFSNFGRCHVIPVYKIPIVEKNHNGQFLANYLNLAEGEKIIEIQNFKPNSLKNKSLIFVTEKGFVKRLNLDQLSPRRVTKCITLRDGDFISSILFCKHKDGIILVSNISKAIHFNIDDEKLPVKAQGRTSMGVKGMGLKEEEKIVSATVVHKDKDFLIVFDDGAVKKMSFADIVLRHRGGKGIAIQKDSKKDHIVVAGFPVKEEDKFVIITKNGKVVKSESKKFRIKSRLTLGKSGIKLEKGDKVISANVVNADEVVVEIPDKKEK